MTKSRTIFIGDVHGCYEELQLLIKKINVTKKDKVYLTGDMINKGPYSYKVINFLYKNQDQYKAILGNHEVGFLRWLEGKAPKYESKIYRELKKKVEKNPSRLKYIKGLPKYINRKNFLLVHGGIYNNKEIKDHSKDELTRLRDYDGKLWYEHYTGDKKVIYGHNAIDGVQIREKTVGLDSGCVYGKSLTAYILETGEVISQNSLSIYENVYKEDKTIFKKIKKLFKKGK